MCGSIVVSCQDVLIKILVNGLCAGIHFLKFLKSHANNVLAPRQGFKNKRVHRFLT